MRTLIDATKHADLIYDIGMHKGEDTEFYLRKGFRVVAFEADPDLANLCRDRLGDFIGDGRLTIVEGAILDPDTIGNGQKKVRFYKNVDNSVWGTVSADWAERNERLGTTSKMVEVDAIDFVDAMQRYGVPHYMKIDIEGADMACIKALKRLEKRPDYVSIESDKTSLANIKREIEALRALGYDSFQAVEQSTIPARQVPPQPATEGNYIDYRFQGGSSGLFGSEIGNDWKTGDEVLRQYRFVRVGYYLFGDDGVMNRWTFPGGRYIRAAARRFWKFITRAPAVPGWYDTHARHSSVKD